VQNTAWKKISNQLSRGEEQKIRVSEFAKGLGQRWKREFLRPLTAGGER
jgi:hypothetical protein